MNSVTLDELKELEKNIKKELIIEYNGFIPKDNWANFLSKDIVGTVIAVDIEAKIKDSFLTYSPSSLDFS